MRIPVLSVFAFALMCLSGAGEAVNAVRYAQQVSGSATGELLVEDLAEGPLKVLTPGRPDLQVGIKRMADRALVWFADTGPPIDDAELKVVLKQGGQEFPFKFPLAIEEGKKEPAPEIGLDREIRKTPEPGNPERVVSAAERQASRNKAASAPPDRVARRVPVCPTLVVPPGSLYAATARLAAECGHVLGTWHPGDAETLLDFEVADLKAVDNPDGVQGLLRLLKQYGLLGVIRYGTGLIDIYEHKTGPRT